MPLVTTNLHFTPELVREWGSYGHYVVFGDNVERVGYGGQAAACRGMSNAIGIATKLSPEEYANDFSARFLKYMLKDLWILEKWLSLGKVVYFPSAGIGTGLAKMEEKSPHNWLLLQFTLKRFRDVYGTHIDD